MLMDIKNTSPRHHIIIMSHHHMSMRSCNDILLMHEKLNLLPILLRVKK